MKYRMLLICVFMAGCGNSETESLNKTINQLREDNEKLRSEIHYLKNGPETLINSAKRHIEDGKYEEAKKFTEELISNFPASKEFPEAKLLQSQIRNRIALEKEKIIEARKKALQLMLPTYDKIDKITWYHHRDTPDRTTSITLYIGTSENNVWLRKKVIYFADDWLFANSFTIYADGETANYPNAEFERDHSSGRIWEWSDSPVSDSDIGTLKKTANAKDAVLRFIGQNYHRDHKITKFEQAVIRDTIQAYEAITASNNK